MTTLMKTRAPRDCMARELADLTIPIGSIVLLLVVLAVTILPMFV